MVIGELGAAEFRSAVGSRGAQSRWPEQIFAFISACLLWSMGSVQRAQTWEQREPGLHLQSFHIGSPAPSWPFPAVHSVTGNKRLHHCTRLCSRIYIHLTEFFIVTVTSKAIWAASLSRWGAAFSDTSSLSCPDAGALDRCPIALSASAAKARKGCYKQSSRKLMSKMNIFPTNIVHTPLSTLFSSTATL